MTTTTSGDLQLLSDCHRETLTMRQRHVAVARLVSNYAFNNTYQYVIAREDVHLSWLEAAILELGGTPATVPEPSLAAGRGKANDAFLPLVAEDARESEAFATRWRAKLGEFTNARHRTMLQLMCGETLEQKRFFDQMLAGREDLLGRRSNGEKSPGTGDGVMAVRWLGQ
jgi:hypothetical protein